MTESNIGKIKVKHGKIKGSPILSLGIEAEDQKQEATGWTIASSTGSRPRQT